MLHLQDKVKAQGPDLMSWLITLMIFVSLKIIFHGETVESLGSRFMFFFLW